jgi:tRNA dimethylallyltransferase
VISLIGASGSGKSALALELAERIGGELVCIDSTTVYRGLDIGTAKPDATEQRRVPHHLIDRLDLHESATAGWFRLRALEAIADIEARGAVPILVGGSHLYLKALIEGYDIPEVVPNWDFRSWAEQQAVGDLWSELVRLDPGSETLVDRQNPRRVIRALEVTRAGTPFSAGYAKRPPAFRVLQLGLDAFLEPDWLRPRLIRRIEAMFAAGWVEEVRSLSRDGHRPDLERLRVIGYGEVLELLDGTLSEPEARERILLATWRLVKKQRTWYRREIQTRWLDPAGTRVGEALEAWQAFQKEQWSSRIHRTPLRGSSSP